MGDSCPIQVGAIKAAERQVTMIESCPLKVCKPKAAAGFCVAIIKAAMIERYIAKSRGVEPATDKGAIVESELQEVATDKCHVRKVAVAEIQVFGKRLAVVYPEPGCCQAGCTGLYLRGEALEAVQNRWVSHKSEPAIARSSERVTQLFTRQVDSVLASR